MVILAAMGTVRAATVIASEPDSRIHFPFIRRASARSFFAGTQIVMPIAAWTTAAPQARPASLVDLLVDLLEESKTAETVCSCAALDSKKSHLKRIYG